MLVSPSLLSADFGQLDKALDMLNGSRAAMVHLDVMDGEFVPNISFGFPVIKAVSRRTAIPMDVHLMVIHPERWIQRLQELGARIFCFHQEACVHIQRTVQAVHDAGMLAGLALNPATPLVTLEDILPELDLVLLMSVNPGYGGQKFLQLAVDKVRRLRGMIQACGSKAKIEVDGGVNLSTGALLAQAGADIVVAGNAVFSATDPAAEIAKLSDL